MISRSGRTNGESVTTGRDLTSDAGKISYEEALFLNKEIQGYAYTKAYCLTEAVFLSEKKLMVALFLT